MTKPQVSLVLPAYNEAAHLRACLDAIFAQTVQPYEVIVVDNNSTDETAAIARSYVGVRVLSEKRQGVVYARNRGFDAARGDIIGRIDADTVIEPTWVASLLRVFQEDENLAAASGRMHYYDVALSGLVDACDGYFRRALARQLEQQDLVFLQGANMGMRRTSWRHVREHVCGSGGFHEDFDLAIHLQELGLEVRYDDRLRAGISARRTDVGFLSFLNYVHMSPHTYAIHGKNRIHKIYGVSGLALVAYLPARLLHRGYDPRTERFSLKRVFTLRSISRPNPASSNVR